MMEGSAGTVPHPPRRGRLRDARPAPHDPESERSTSMSREHSTTPSASEAPGGTGWATRAVDRLARRADRLPLGRASLEHTIGRPEELHARSWVSGARTGLLAGAGLAGLGVGTLAAVAGYYARYVVTPPKPGGNEDLRVLGVGYDTDDPAPDAVPTSVTLPANDETLSPGRYLLVFDGGRHSAIVGGILSYSPGLSTVVRAVETVHSGNLSTAARARWSGAVYLDPRDAGFAYEDVMLDLPVGRAPAWLVPAGSGPARTWAIMVHGRGARREETLRALETTQQLGLTSLHLSYRNDPDAPPSEDGRYGLGVTEWEDVEVAIDYAMAHGAEEIVLFGWSMGGAICLQTAAQSRWRSRIRAMVLDGPVVDWLELIAYHTRLLKMPLRVGELVSDLLGSPRASIMTGLGEPIRLMDLDWLSRSDELTVPTLILHSVQDDFVPVSTSEKLARRNPRVTLVEFARGKHTKEWNADPQRWKDAVLQWLPRRLGRD